MDKSVQIPVAYFRLSSNFCRRCLFASKEEVHTVNIGITAWYGLQEMKTVIIGYDPKKCLYYRNNMEYLICKIIIYLV
jgi:hypothetical protein